MSTAEQQARDLLERMGIAGAQSFSAGDLIELANLIARAPRAQPEPVALARPKCFDFAMDFVGDPEETEVRRYVESLEARPAINPVPASERLPEPEDCDAEGRCWIFMPDIATDPSWRLANPREIGPYHTHWLPANALPTPEATNA
jgi:hypothetical protein